MGTSIQIRDVPEHVHRKLKARAALAGVSQSEYAPGVFARAASRPTPSELAARVRAWGAAELAKPSEALVRELRDGFE